MFLTTIEKLPSISVMVASIIRSLLSRSVTLTIISGPSESLKTFPEIRALFCAKADVPTRQQRASNIKCFIFIMAFIFISQLMYHRYCTIPEARCTLCPRHLCSYPQHQPICTHILRSYLPLWQSQEHERHRCR